MGGGRCTDFSSCAFWQRWWSHHTRPFPLRLAIRSRAGPSELEPLALGEFGGEFGEKPGLERDRLNCYTEQTGARVTQCKIRAVPTFVPQAGLTVPDTGGAEGGTGTSLPLMGLTFLR